MSVTINRPVRRRPVFHPLPVRAVDRLTEDAVAVTFEVPARLRETFAFRAGQHLTVRRVPPDGAEVRRSYSICSTPAELAATGRLRIGVREVPGGAFSSFAVSALRAGDTVEVLPPLGTFGTAFAPDRVRHYAGVVAGSGITPVLSLVATALAVEPASTFTLVYGNRHGRTVMFVEELADLKDRYPERLHLVHVLSREPGESPLLSGRVDAERLGRLLDTIVPAERIDEWFLCGPYGMVLDARLVLTGRGVPERAVHAELFHVDAPPAPPVRPAATAADAGTEVTIRLDGRTSGFRMGRDERVLDAALRVRSELPYACKGGVCSTCRARVVSGEVSMARNYALEPDEVAAGYVLTCQASPVTDTLEVDYDG
ncbi:MULTISPECIES: 1,2-phenylacetyl-CoA epoxidase subunit PaaE [unclassified Plantactinospora]|uniref:1,2-phenylacetyl-CoA epoxidase subunit PaaE n=1 Tax=unclassified Plantactinospora TaxID=2631981 RepID=UPI000D15C573|nr:MULTISPECIES: 1,2-phenylacetyl-CoA epoxidase subunit PaaE [unclassified Plantactinospora]AVT31198.1 phenylacetate-CoA oxygenase/reductase subunit PaaK [Plantactinospora sp. BC1]AVT39744.1 phenylacetate-CoA oxygenase/reductase subunit PaaK [Plantactinospora sp. BB1]